MRQHKGIQRRGTRGLAIKKEKLTFRNSNIRKKAFPLKTAIFPRQSLLRENIKSPFNRDTLPELQKNQSSHYISTGRNPPPQTRGISPTRRKTAARSPASWYTHVPSAVLRGGTPPGPVGAVPLSAPIPAASRVPRAPEQHRADISRSRAGQPQLSFALLPSAVRRLSQSACWCPRREGPVSALSSHNFSSSVFLHAV